MSEWQPIETAPKNGTRIWILPGHWPAHWSTEIQFKDQRPTGWLIHEEDDPWYTLWYTPEHVTHWMPLAEGPK